MRNVELVMLAWRNLRRRKSRTILTVISVVIGAVAVNSLPNKSSYSKETLME